MNPQRLIIMGKIEKDVIDLDLCNMNPHRKANIRSVLNCMLHRCEGCTCAPCAEDCCIAKLQEKHDKELK